MPLVRDVVVAPASSLTSNDREGYAAPWRRRHLNTELSGISTVRGRDVHGNGIPNGTGNPMGIPWEWE